MSNDCETHASVHCSLNEKQAFAEVLWCMVLSELFVERCIRLFCDKCTEKYRISGQEHSAEYSRPTFSFSPNPACPLLPHFHGMHFRLAKVPALG